MTYKQSSTEDFFSLQEVVETPLRKQSFLGVVLDATGTYKTDDSFDYVCKLKVIDSSYNPKNQSRYSKKAKLEPFVQVFIFSPKLALSPKIH